MCVSFFSFFPCLEVEGDYRNDDPCQGHLECVCVIKLKIRVSEKTCKSVISRYLSSNPKNDEEKEEEVGIRVKSKWMQIPIKSFFSDDGDNQCVSGPHTSVPLLLVKLLSVSPLPPLFTIFNFLQLPPLSPTVKLDSRFRFVLACTGWCTRFCCWSSLFDRKVFICDFKFVPFFFFSFFFCFCPERFVAVCLCCFFQSRSSVRVWVSECSPCPSFLVPTDLCNSSAWPTASSCSSFSFLTNDPRSSDVCLKAIARAFLPATCNDDLQEQKWLLSSSSPSLLMSYLFVMPICLEQGDRLLPVMFEGGLVQNRQQTAQEWLKDSIRFARIDKTKNDERELRKRPFHVHKRSGISLLWMKEERWRERDRKGKIAWRVRQWVDTGGREMMLLHLLKVVTIWVWGKEEKKGVVKRRKEIKMFWNDQQ